MENQDSPEKLRLKRLRYRSWHRGCKETDVILGHFADEHLHTLTPAQLDIYENMLEEQDVDIWNWLTEAAVPAEEAYISVLGLLKEYSSSHYQSQHRAQ